MHVSAALLLISLQLPALGQSATSGGNQATQAPASERGNAAEVPFILKTTTREIVVGVVAIDSHNHPVNGMKESELELFVVPGWRQKSRRAITSFQAVDAAIPRPHIDSPSGGFQVASSERCAIRRSSHYEIAFHPSPLDWTGGYHEILVTTSRPNVKLSYRRRYFVGETRTLSKSSLPADTNVDALLQQAACYHPATPPSISLAAQPVESGSTGSLRYSFIVQADSLAFISLSNEARRVQLDLGVCTFDAEGIPLYFLHTSIERELTPLEYERALVLGFQKQLEFPKQGDPSLVRFVVRDRRTGNLGTLSLTTANPARDGVANEQKEATQTLRESQAEEDRKRESKDYIYAAKGPIRSFGTILPQPGAMCGDVYELPEGARNLPDFWNHDPIGTVYTYELNVPPQNIMSSSAIPGVTKTVEWFGIDYYGEFWIDAPGEYTFQLFSDDGARLYIDGNQVVDLDGLHIVLNREVQIHLDAGRHTLHLPYYQGPQGLALMLLVKPPGGQYRVFNLQDFSPPAEAF